MKFWIAILAALIAASPAHAFLHRGGGAGGIIAQPEEFVGPFPSWYCVQSNAANCGAANHTVCTATGDGTTDDTTAFNNCLALLGSSHPVIYVPSGTYKITSTLNLAALKYVSVIGQNPATTTILFSGTGGTDMLHLNGVAYSRVDRITFNGQNLAGIAVNQSWVGTGNYFDTGNEYADDVFENVGVGFFCGALGAGCAETAILRDKFINNSNAGIATGNFNALDAWIWYSLFQNNPYAITNTEGGGNFHAYNSVFLASTTADIGIGNTGFFNFRNNYSSGSAYFLNAAATNNSAELTLQGNTILDTTSTNSGSSISVLVGNLGPLVLIDNVIRGVNGAVSPAVYAGGFGPPVDLFSMGNTYTAGVVASDCSGTPPAANNGGHCHSVNDQVVSRGTVNPSQPVLPGPPPNYNRTIFEVTAGSSTATIQTAINNAAAAGTRSVVHIQPGTYSITSTLVVPTNSDMQIIGDGGNSILSWAGSTGPLLKLTGPSKAVLRDFQIEIGGSAIDGILISNADQVGSRVFIEQAYLTASKPNLFVDALDHTTVEMHDSPHSYTAPTGTSVVVTGGPSASSGSWLGGATNIFAGASGGNYLAYGISAGAHVLLFDTWNDNGGCSPTCNQIASVTGSHTAFTDAGAALYLLGGTVGVSLNNFQGTAALVNLLTDVNMNLTGTGSGAQVAGIGLVGLSSSFFSDTTSPAASIEFLNGRETTTQSPLSEIGTADPTFLSATLNQLRTTQPTLPISALSGVTDARLYRVYVDQAAAGIHVQAP